MRRIEGAQSRHGAEQPRKPVRPEERNAHAPDEFTTVNDVIGLARALLFYLSAEFDGETSPAWPSETAAGRCR